MTAEDQAPADLDEELPGNTGDPGRPEGPGDPEEPEPEPGEPGEPDPLGPVLAGLAAVEERLADFHRRSAHRESVIDRLHEENQQLRVGMSRAILEPVVTDLIRLYDQLDREGRRLGGAPSGALLLSFADDVAMVLERCGLEVFTADPGDPFQPDRHRPLSVVPCQDAALHNTVAEVVAAGFADRGTGRIRRPVQARFHQHTPPPDGAPGDTARDTPRDTHTGTPSDAAPHAPANAPEGQ